MINNDVCLLYDVQFYVPQIVFVLFIFWSSEGRQMPTIFVWRETIACLLICKRTLLAPLIFWKTWQNALLNRLNCRKSWAIKLLWYLLFPVLLTIRDIFYAQFISRILPVVMYSVHCIIALLRILQRAVTGLIPVTGWGYKIWREIPWFLTRKARVIDNKRYWKNPFSTDF